MRISEKFLKKKRENLNGRGMSFIYKNMLKQLFKECIKIITPNEAA